MEDTILHNLDIGVGQREHAPVQQPRVAAAVTWPRHLLPYGGTICRQVADRLPVAIVADEKATVPEPRDLRPRFDG